MSVEQMVEEHLKAVRSSTAGAIALALSIKPVQVSNALFRLKGKKRAACSNIGRHSAWRLCERNLQLNFIFSFDSMSEKTHCQSEFVEFQE